jgi:hypothetical protein
MRRSFTPDQQHYLATSDTLIDEEIVEIIGMVALGAFRNYFDLVVGSDVDFPLVRTHSGG